MRLVALFALVAGITGAGTYFGATALGGNTAVRQPAAVASTDPTPNAALFARALTGAANQFAGGRVITNAHCVKGSPGHYMCTYGVLRPDGMDCQLMQGVWTPGEASTITVTLAGQTGECGSIRDAIRSLG